MVVLTDKQTHQKEELRIYKIMQRDVVGFFLYKKSIQEGQKRDLQINDFIFEDTKEAFNNMNQGYFYDHETNVR